MKKKKLTKKQEREEYIDAAPGDESGTRSGSAGTPHDSGVRYHGLAAWEDRNWALVGRACERWLAEREQFDLRKLNAKQRKNLEK